MTVTADPPVKTPPSDYDGRHDNPRSLSLTTFDDFASLIGAGTASLATVWLLYDNIFPTSGKIGFFIFWYVAFIGFYTLAVSFKHPRPVVIDKMVSALVAGGAALVLVALAWTVGYIVYRGHSPLGHLKFYYQSQSQISSSRPHSGGIFNAIIGSVIEVAIAVLISVPAGIGCAIYMTEIGGRLARVVRTVIEAMTALPDLVAGLFVYYFLIALLARFHWAAQTIATKDGLAASLALSITMLPIIARTSDVQLRVVPAGLREAGFALGSSHWATVRQVILPTARPGLASAVILGIARAIGETAPVLIVSAASTFLQFDPIGKAMNSLPLAAYNYIRFGTTPQQQNLGFAAALVLLLVVVILSTSVRLITRQRAGR